MPRIARPRTPGADAQKESAMLRVTNSFGWAALLAGVTALGLAGAAGAQDAQGEIEEIIVTGSYIKQTPEDATLPVDVINSEELFNQGSPSVVELVRRLGVSSGVDGETNQFASNGLNGVASINLRGLGPGRTLVLLNGRRNVWSGTPITEQAQLFVDINQLPAIAFQRVEILKDGAAATYGSDAVGGVTNFITRSDFEGFEVSSAYKNIQGSDGDFDIGAIAGRAFGNSNLVVSGGWSRRSEMSVQERDWALQPFGTGGNRLNYTGIPNPGSFYPLDTDAGADGLFGTADDENAIPELIPGTARIPVFGIGAIRDPRCEDFVGEINDVPLGGNAGDGDAPDVPYAHADRKNCTYSYLYFDNLAEKEERWQIMAEFTSELSADHSFNAEFLIADTDVPEWKTSPSYPPQTLADLNPLTGRLIPSYHPGLEAFVEANGYAQFAGFRDADGVGGPDTVGDCVTADDPHGHQCDTLLFFGRPKGVRGPQNDGSRTHAMWRVAFGFEGALTENIEYTTSFLWSESESENQTNDTIVERWNLAFRGLGGERCNRDPMQPGGLTPGENDCLWYNPFSNSIKYPQAPRFDPDQIDENPDFDEAVAYHGDDASLVENTDELYDWMEDTLGIQYESELAVFDAVISGDTMLTSPSGDSVKFAVGFQWRKETWRRMPYAINDLSQNPCVTEAENARFRATVAGGEPGYGEVGAPLCDFGTSELDPDNAYLQGLFSPLLTDVTDAETAATAAQAALDALDDTATATAMMMAMDALDDAVDVRDAAREALNDLRTMVEGDDYEGSGVFPFLAGTTPFEDDQDIFALFGELFVPFTDNVEGQFSVRYEDYGGDVGDTIDPKVALRWQVTDTLALRGSLSTTFRGPGLNQLSGRATTLAFVQYFPIFTFKAVDVEGNPDLEPESATTLNLGAILDLGDLYASIDFWSFNFEDTIVREDFNSLIVAAFQCGPLLPGVTQCGEFKEEGGALNSRFDLAGGSNQAGNIQRIRTSVVNGPDIETSGIDFALRYGFDAGPGRAELSATGTWTLNYDVSAYQTRFQEATIPTYDGLGKLNESVAFLRPVIELKATIGARYEMESHLLNLVANYTSDYKDRGGTRDVEAQTTVDFHYNMDIGGALNIAALESSSFWVSAYNITDQDPPFARNDLNYDPFTHSAFGRIIKFGVRYAF